MDDGKEEGREERNEEEKKEEGPEVKKRANIASNLHYNELPRSRIRKNQLDATGIDVCSH